MESSGGCGSSSISRRSKEPWDGNCNHRVPAKLRTVRKGVNAGEKFYGCSFSPGDDCGVFKWEKEVQLVGASPNLQMQLCEKEKMVGELEAHKRNMEEQIQKLRLKKQQLKVELAAVKDEVENLRFELLKSGAREKNLALGLVFSWIMYALYLAYLK